MTVAAVSVDCPVCGLAAQAGPSCRRCKADLGLLCDLEQSRQRALAHARGHLREGRFVEALSAARRALALHRDGEGMQLVALCHLLRQEFAAALAAHSGR